MKKAEEGKLYLFFNYGIRGAISGADVSSENLALNDEAIQRFTNSYRNAAKRHKLNLNI